jgi:hypothetical protein
MDTEKQEYRDGQYFEALKQKRESHEKDLINFHLQNASANNMIAFLNNKRNMKILLDMNKLIEVFLR